MPEPIIITKNKNNKSDRENSKMRPFLRFVYIIYWAHATKGVFFCADYRLIITIKLYLRIDLPKCGRT